MMREIARLFWASILHNTVLVIGIVVVWHHL